MTKFFDLRIEAAIIRAVSDADLTVNVPVKAEEIRRQYAEQNVALEDIEARLADVALACGRFVEFDKTASANGKAPAAILEISSDQIDPAVH